MSFTPTPTLASPLTVPKTEHLAKERPDRHLAGMDKVTDSFPLLHHVLRPYKRT